MTFFLWWLYGASVLLAFWFGRTTRQKPTGIERDLEIAEAYNAQLRGIIERSLDTNSARVHRGPYSNVSPPQFEIERTRGA